MLIKKALYGLKSSGAAFRALLAETFYDLGYTPTKADPDVYLRKAAKPNGTAYYEMALVYVDDILVISHEPLVTMSGIQRQFKLKDDKIEPPDMYLGAKLSNTLINGVSCWTMSSEQYVKTAVGNVEKRLAESNRKLPTRCSTPLMSGYRPEIDVSQELNA
jgi:hypothetical protein